MKNILVTGGAGFIGSNLVHALIRDMPEARVINLDALTYASTRHSIADLDDHPRHVFIEGDICDRDLVEKVVDDHSIDTVVHLAAESHVDRSISGPKAFIDTNITGTFALLEVARARGTRFHHVSTDEVYGSLGPDDPAFTETTPYDPSSPYSASKAASDHLVRAYHHTYDLPITISNCSNNYGPYQFPEKLIPLMIQNAINGKPLPVYGDGAQVRDWLHVSDHCAAICVILERGRIGGTYNVGGNNQPTNLEIVKQLCALVDARFPDSPHAPREQLIQFVTDRPGHDRRYAIDISKIESELGWTPTISLEQGLRDTVDWYLDNDEWLRSIAERPNYQDWIRSHYASTGENE